MAFMTAVYFLPLLPSARPPSLLSSRLPTDSRQTVELPSQDDMEDDERENANERARREDRPAVWMPLRPQPPRSLPRSPCQRPGSRAWPPRGLRNLWALEGALHRTTR